MVAGPVVVDAEAKPTKVMLTKLAVNRKVTIAAVILVWNVFVFVPPGW
jgi:hypothetical protein